MPKQHTVRDGECISSIADRYGFFTDTIWNDPANSELKSRREDPNLLVPCDEMTIPDKRQEEVAKTTDAAHRFKKKGVPSLFRLQVMYTGKPRSEQEYYLSIDDALFLKGTTDADGVLEEFIPPNARRGELMIGPDRYRRKLQFGFLEPTNTIRGIQQRLNNLGHSCGLGRRVARRIEQGDPAVSGAMRTARER